jgi:hypothetical protein
MSSSQYIPLSRVRKQIADIDARLRILRTEYERIETEKETLDLTRKVLSDLENGASNATRSGRRKSSAVRPADDAIPDGKVATPIILGMIAGKPGITSGEIFDALESRVTKKGPKRPRKFLGDLIWELGHRNKLRRDPGGGLYLVNEGGAS